MFRTNFYSNWNLSFYNGTIFLALGAIISSWEDDCLERFLRLDLRRECIKRGCADRGRLSDRLIRSASSSKSARLAQLNLRSAVGCDLCRGGR